MDDLPPPGANPFLEIVAARVSDPQRLAAVASTLLLDTGAEESFDRVARLASRVLGTPYGFVTVVDDRRSYWKACIGIDSDDPADRQNGVEESFCQYVIGVDDVFLIDDARLDERTSGNPSIESMGLRAWAGAPLRAPTGEVLGTVCVVDTVERAWATSDGEVLKELAGVAAEAIAARRTAREALEAEAVLDEILARSPIGFALLDADLRYLMINQSLAELNGLAIADHLGRSITEVIPEAISQVEPILKAILSTGEPLDGIEIVGQTSSQPGVDRILSGTFFRIGGSPDDYRIGVLLSDITERSRSLRRAERLAGLATELAKATSRTDVGRIIGSLIPTYFDGSFAAAGSIEQNGTIEIITDAPNADVVAPLGIDFGKRTVYSEAFNTGSMVLVSDTAKRLARFPDAAPATDQFDALAALPLRRVDGTVNGVLVIGWPHPIHDDEFPRSQLVTVAEVLGQTLERVEASGERKALTDAMQHTLLAPTPTPPGMQVAARYVPATSTIGFGGDWYDVIELTDHQVALVVGDVVGHDPVAAARMSTVRTIVATLIKQRTPLGEIFGNVEALLLDNPAAVRASIAICMIDTKAKTLSVASAGHPPLLIASPSGVVERVEQSLRPWIGVGGQASPLPVVRYEPGTTILAYTDGLIETRQSDIDTDILRLAKLLTECVDETVDRIADDLITGAVGTEGASDDVALIVAKL